MVLSKLSGSVLQLNCCFFGDSGGKKQTKPGPVWFILEPEGAGNLNSSNQTSLGVSLQMVMFILTLCNRVP